MWRNEYDAAGRPLSASDPFGHTTTFEYDDVGNKVRETDAEQKVKLFSYDGKGRLTRSTDGAGGVSVFTYNSSGNLVKQTDPEGKSVQYQYDLRERVSRMIDGNGNETRFEYEESSGCSTCASSPEKPWRVIYPTFTKEFEYDSRGRKITEKEILSASETYASRFRYDASGNLTSSTDREGKTTSYTYDALNRVTRVSDPMGYKTYYGYDSRDNLLSLTDANGNTTRFAYDRNNRQVEETRPMGQETRYGYDGVGNLTTKVDPKNQKTVYQYDAAGRLDEIRYFEQADDLTPVKTVNLAYDRTGHLKGYNDGTTSSEYLYDDAYRKTYEAVDYGDFTLASQTAWYANGTKKSFTGPDGVTYDYTYDGSNQLASVAIPGQGFITINAYTWNRPALITYPGGTTRELAYDPLMRTRSITVRDPAQSVLMDYQYTHDREDNVKTKKTEHGDYTYGYDDLYRLKSAENPSQTPEAFSYDPVGNRLTSAGIEGTWSHNENNELESYDGVTLTYDANGNTIAKTVGSGTDALITRYVYDVENQLIRVESGSGVIVAQYVYDPFGRRLWKEVSGARTYFNYADEGLIGEYNYAGEELKTYGFRPHSTETTDPLFVKQSGNYFFYQNDHLGTPMQLITSSGAVAWSARYTSFGEGMVDSASTITNNLRFPGQYYDAGTGLHYNWHRFYDPRTGRFLTPDPIRQVGQSTQLYSYLDGNPLHDFDPYGLFGWRDTAGFVPIIGSLLDAYDAFGCGNTAIGLLNLGLSALDLTGASALVKGIAVGTMKFSARKAINNVFRNSRNWPQMRQGLQNIGQVARNSMSTPRRNWSTTDHIFFKQRGNAPHELLNHPINLQTDVPLWLNSAFEGMGLMQRALYLPTWMKLTALGATSYAAGLGVGSGVHCDCK